MEWKVEDVYQYRILTDARCKKTPKGKKVPSYLLVVGVWKLVPRMSRKIISCRFSCKRVELANSTSLMRLPYAVFVF